ncbi:MAG: Hpt domain-containing protein [Terracidiphilus sp.]|jgi:HPt (histidine-containing phosphotransfer) domain-containing protein
MAAAGQPALSQALDRMWNRFLPEIEERIAILETAAAEFAALTLSTEQCEAATSAAHKLAGVLGIFGLARGTDLARELENLYSRPNGPEPAIGARLASLAAELRTMIESRR